MKIKKLFKQCFPHLLGILLLLAMPPAHATSQITPELLKTICTEIEHKISNRLDLASKSDYAIYLYTGIAENQILEMMQEENRKSFIEYNELNVKLLKEAAHGILLHDKERELLFVKLAKSATEIKLHYPKEYKIMGNYIESLLQLWEKRKSVLTQKRNKQSGDNRAQLSSIESGADDIEFERLPKSVQTFLISYVMSILIAEIEIFKIENLSMEKIEEQLTKDIIRILSTTDTRDLPESYKIVINQYIALCNDSLLQKNSDGLAQLESNWLLLSKRYPKEFNLITNSAYALARVLEGFNLIDYSKFLIYSRDRKEQSSKHMIYRHKKLIEIINLSCQPVK